MSCELVNNTSYNVAEITPFVKDLYSFSQKRLGFNRPPVINFDSNLENAENVLGKTAWYEPDSHIITILIDKRHPKDILRSIAHELVHHSQNCRGEFDGTETTEAGYAQNDEHMREMEREAYEQGNLCLRDWEDLRKKTLNETNYYTNGRINKMSLKENVENMVNIEEVDELEELAPIEGIEEFEIDTLELGGDADSRVRWRDEGEPAMSDDGIEDSPEHWLSPDAKEGYKASEEGGWEIGDDLTTMLERIRTIIKESEVKLDKETIRKVIHEALAKVALREHEIRDVEDVAGDPGPKSSETKEKDDSLSQYPDESDFSGQAYKRDDDEAALEESDTYKRDDDEEDTSEVPLDEWYDNSLFEALKKRWTK